MIRGRWVWLGVDVIRLGVDGIWLRADGVGVDGIKLVTIGLG